MPRSFLIGVIYYRDLIKEKNREEPGDLFPFDYIEDNLYE
jgi:hypothetical protein